MIESNLYEEVITDDSLYKLKAKKKKKLKKNLASFLFLSHV